MKTYLERLIIKEGEYVRAATEKYKESLSELESDLKRHLEERIKTMKEEDFHNMREILKDKNGNLFVVDHAFEMYYKLHLEKLTAFLSRRDGMESLQLKMVFAHVWACGKLHGEGVPIDKINTGKMSIVEYVDYGLRIKNENS